MAFRGFIEKRLPKYACLVAAAAILVAITGFQPYWGLMDDARMAFGLVPEIDEFGLWSTVKKFTEEDLVWGMFRPLYPIMGYFLYKPGTVFSPTVTFLFNAVFTLFVVGLNAFTFGRILKISPWRIALVAASFFYAYDLFQHPSLQEKLVLLFGPLLVLACWSQRSATVSGIALIFFISVLGTLSKASIAVFIPMAFVAYLSRHREEVLKLSPRIFFFATILAAIFVVEVAFLAWVSKGGMYTSQYSLGKIIPNIQRLDGAMFLTLIAIGVVSALWVRFWRDRWEALIPALGILAFLVVFLPWGITAYLQSLVAVVVGALLVQAIEVFIPGKLAWIWIVPATLSAFLVGSYRIKTQFTRLHDLGRIAHASPELWHANGVQIIYMPCEEGSASMRQVFKRAGRAIEVDRLESFENLDGKTILFDGAMCPLPGRAFEIPGCKQTFVYEPQWKKSYRVVKLSCR